MPAGQPTYDPTTNTFTFSFKFTNPLQNTISVENISTKVFCKDHRAFLGNITIDDPMTIAPDQTIIINASGSWAQAALDHFETYHNSPEDDDINVSFQDLNVYALFWISWMMQALISEDNFEAALTGLVAGILTFIVLGVSLFVPWWQLTIGEDL
jgi:hypothetical protein